MFNLKLGGGGLNWSTEEKKGFFLVTVPMKTYVHYVCRSSRPGWIVLSQRWTSLHCGLRRRFKVSIFAYKYLSDLWTCTAHLYH